MAYGHSKARCDVLMLPYSLLWLAMQLAETQMPTSEELHAADDSIAELAAAFPGTQLPTGSAADTSPDDETAQAPAEQQPTAKPAGRRKAKPAAAADAGNEVKQELAAAKGRQPAGRGSRRGKATAATVAADADTAACVLSGDDPVGRGSKRSSSEEPGTGAAGVPAKQTAHKTMGARRGKAAELTDAAPAAAGGVDKERSSSVEPDVEPAGVTAKQTARKTMGRAPKPPKVPAAGKRPARGAAAKRQHGVSDREGLESDAEV